MISSGQTAVGTPAVLTGSVFVPVCLAAAWKLAALTTVDMVGMLGSVMLKVVSTGGWSGLVTDRVQSQVSGHTGRPVVRVKYSLGTTTCRTWRLRSVCDLTGSKSVVALSCTFTTEVRKKLSP